MINISTYARDVELKRFAHVNEEADPNFHRYGGWTQYSPPAGSAAQLLQDALKDPLASILAAKLGTGADQATTTAWNQLKNDIIAKVNANPPVYTGTVNLAVPAGQIPVEWKVAEDTGIVSYTNTSTKFTASGSKGTPSATPAAKPAGQSAAKPAAKPADTAKFDDLTLKLLKAMQGMGTDEEAITDVFTGIKSQDEFTKFAQYFGSLKMGYDTYGSRKGFNASNAMGSRNAIDFPKFKVEAANRKYTNDCSLAYWIGQELDTNEVAHLNTLLKSNGIGSQFLAL